MGRAKVVGIGSPHGDDQAGWRVVELLAESDTESIAVANPTSILDHLEDCCHMILVDAFQNGAPGSILRFSWPDPCIRTLTGSSSHGFDVGAVLTLADNLGKLPRLVTIYVIGAKNCERNQELSPAVEAALPDLCCRIQQELRESR